MADDGGISRLHQRLAAIPARFKEAVQPALLKQAEATKQTMEQFVPVDSGDLKASIAVTTAGNSTPPYSQPGGSTVIPENAVAITVGDEDVRYGHLVEYGTKDTPAQAYFWPAVRLHNKKAKTAIKRAVSTGIRKNWGKV